MGIQPVTGPCEFNLCQKCELNVGCIRPPGHEGYCMDGKCNEIFGANLFANAVRNAGGLEVSVLSMKAKPRVSTVGGAVESSDYEAKARTRAHTDNPAKEQSVPVFNMTPEKHAQAPDNELPSPRRRVVLMTDQVRRVELSKEVSTFADSSLCQKRDANFACVRPAGHEGPCTDDHRKYKCLSDIVSKALSTSSAPPSVSKSLSTTTAAPPAAPPNVAKGMSAKCTSSRSRRVTLGSGERPSDYFNSSVINQINASLTASQPANYGSDRRGNVPSARKQQKGPQQAKDHVPSTPVAEPRHFRWQ